MNGRGKLESEVAQQSLPATLVELLENGVFEPLDESAFRSADDRLKIAEAEVMKSFSGGIKSIKQKVQFNVAVQDALRHSSSRARGWTGRSSRKRTADAHLENGSKRQKLTNGNHTNGISQTSHDEYLGLDVGS